MRNKFLKTLAIGGILATSLATFTACGEPKHTHNISSSLVYDEYNHYKDASCGYFHHREDVAPHTSVDSCTVCGYDASAEEEPEFSTPNTSGDTTFGAFSLSGNEISFGSVKNATKYVLTAKNSRTGTLTADIKNSASKFNLNKVFNQKFPAGKTTIELEAYELYSETIEGEKIEEEIPMTGTKKTSVIYNINGTFSLQDLGYADDYLTFNGVYKLDNELGESEDKFVYELNLTNNNKTRFDISKLVSVESGVNVAFYKTKNGRENNLSDDKISGFDLLAVEHNHGDNYYYIRVVDSSSNIKDYTLIVRGLYNLEVSKFKVTISHTANEDGTRDESYTQIGESFNFNELDVLSESELFSGIDEENIIARDSYYNKIGRGDFKVELGEEKRLEIYYYDEETVIKDCSEFENALKTFEVTQSSEGLTLFSSRSELSTIEIPYLIAGRKVLTTSIWYSEAVETIKLSRGFKTYSVSIFECPNIEKVYLPSTITSMSARPFNKLPSTATLYCAFSSSDASSFNDFWNYVDGSLMGVYSTLYNQTEFSGPSVDTGITYRLENNELIVQSTSEDFGGKIPDSAVYNGSRYPVTKIENLFYTYNKNIVIGKNIKEIRVGAFSTNNNYNCGMPATIEVDSENTFFTIYHGALYDKGLTRAIALSSELSYHIMPLTIETIDYHFKSYASSHTDRCLYNPFNSLSELNSVIAGSSYSFNSVDGNKASYVYENNVGYICYTTVTEAEDKTAGVVKIDCKDELNIKQYVNNDYLVNTVIGKILPLKTIKKLSSPYTILKSQGYDFYHKVIGMEYGDEAIFENIEELNIIGNLFNSDAYSIKSMYPNLKTINVTGSEYLSVQDNILYSGNDIILVPNDLPSSVTIKEGITSIYTSTFEGRNFENITLPSTLLEIGVTAFKNCRNLKSVRIPDTVEVIRAGAFEGCVNLTSLSINKKMAERSSFEYIVDHCGKLKEVEFRGTKSELGEYLKYGILSEKSYVVKIKCTDGYVERD